MLVLSVTSYQLSVTSVVFRWVPNRYQLTVRVYQCRVPLFTVYCLLFEKPKKNLRRKAITELKCVCVFSRLELNFRAHNSLS
jgi:hypothetical protein